MSIPSDIAELIIAEKPSVAQDLARAIGGPVDRRDGFLLVGRYAITWALGHLLEQAKPEEYDRRYLTWALDDLVFHPHEWRLRPRSKKDKSGKDLRDSDGAVMLDPGIAKQVKLVGKLLAAARAVVNAGDAGREGQLIVDELLEYFGNQKPVKRLWLQETNLPAIRNALAHMRDNREHRRLYLAALARSRADYLVGMNLTRAYTIAWQQKGNKGVLHFGRVQTPTLSMVVARDLEIEGFVSEHYYSLRALVEHPAGSFDAMWVPAEEIALPSADGKPLGAKREQDAQRVADLVRGRHATIKECTTVEKRVAPPLPFSLGGLQKAANKQFGLSPTETLKVAQNLYQKHKLISYPRTDFEHFPEGDHKYAPRIVAAVRSNFGAQWDFPGNPDFTLKSAAWNDAKIGDHFALRPTEVANYDLRQLTDIERKIYHLVVRQYLAQFYPLYVYDSTVAVIHCEGETFKADGQAVTQSGWRSLFSAGTETRQMLPSGIKPADGCRIGDCALESRKTTPPSRYTGASLIDAMENAYTKVTDDKVKRFIKETGIGTPATRAAIIEGLLDRKYIEEIAEGKGTAYISTAKGRMLYRASPEWIRKPDLTAYFEELLKQVEKGDLEFDAFMQRQHQFLEKQVAAVKSGAAGQSMPSPQEMRQAEEAPRQLHGKGARKISAVGSADIYLSTTQAADAMAEAISRLPLVDKKMVFAVDHLTFRVARSVYGNVPLETLTDPTQFTIVRFRLPDFSVISRPGFSPAQITSGKANDRADCGVLWLAAPRAGDSPRAEDAAAIVVDHYYEQIAKSATKRRLVAKARRKRSGQDKDDEKRCPKCGHALCLRKGDNGSFWGCRGYPDCRYTESSP